MCLCTGSAHSLIANAAAASKLVQQGDIGMLLICRCLSAQACLLSCHIALQAKAKADTAVVEAAKALVAASANAKAEVQVSSDAAAKAKADAEVRVIRSQVVCCRLSTSVDSVAPIAAPVEFKHVRASCWHNNAAVA